MSFCYISPTRHLPSPVHDELSRYRWRIGSSVPRTTKRFSHTCGEPAQSKPSVYMAASAAMDGVAAASLRSVLQRVQPAAERSGRIAQQIRLVAVSKTKPVSVLREVYNAGHRCFGENYVQELVEKAPQLPDDIEWHFIGNLQSNKVKPLLAGVPNLAYVETVDDVKIANHLDRAVANIGRKPLKVFVQVNTSGETY